MEEYFSLIYQKKFEEAKKLRMSNVPKKLLKFVALGDNDKENDKRFKSLSNNQAWFSSIKGLNDPYEFSLMSVDRKKLEKYDYPNKFISAFEDLFSQQLYNWDVLSLSDAGVDSLPMWAYYTNNSSGYCIEYDVVDSSAIFPVSYEKKRILVASLITNFYKEFTEMHKKGELTNPDVEFYAHLFQYQLYSKHISWKHEKEYRIIYPHTSYSTYGQNVNIEFLGLRVNRIISGINCSDENIIKLNTISNNLNCGDVYQTKISSEEFTLIVR